MGGGSGIVGVDGQAESGFSLPLEHTQWCSALSR